LGESLIVAKPSASKSGTKITRISASDSASKAKKPASATKKSIKKPAQSGSTKPKSGSIAIESSAKSQTRNPLVAFGRYIKGSWRELQQVRWPDRRSTWGMTGALLAFTLFFVILILVMDYGFSELFKLIMSK
jgi:hypothetical protein